MEIESARLTGEGYRYGILNHVLFFVSLSIVNSLTKDIIKYVFTEYP